MSADPTPDLTAARPASDDAPTAGRVRRGLGIGTVGNLILRMGNVGVSLIVTRLILPEQFGVFAVALTVWGVLQSIAEFGLGSDLVRCHDLARRLPTVTTVSLLISGGLAVIMAATSPLLADAFDSPESAPIIAVMAVAMLLFGLATVPGALLMRQFRQGSFFLVNLAGLLASTVVMTTMALAGQGPMALAVGQIASQLVTVVGLHVAARHRPVFGFDRPLARESVSFSLPLAGANLVSWVLITVDNLIVSRTLGPFQLAFYVLAFNISSWPMNAVGQAIRVVALPAFARVPTPEARAAAFARVIGPAWALALLLGTSLAVLAGPVIDLLFPDRWSPAAVALIGLGFFGAFRVVFDLTATFLASSGRSRSVLVVQLVWLATLLPVMIFAVGRFGLAGAGWAHVVAVVVVVPAYLIAVRRVGVSTRAVLKTCLVPVLVLAPTVLAQWWIGRLPAHPFMVVLLGGGAALLLFALPLARWWRAQIRSISGPDAHPNLTSDPNPSLTDHVVDPPLVAAPVHSHAGGLPS